MIRQSLRTVWQVFVGNNMSLHVLYLDLRPNKTLGIMVRCVNSYIKQSATRRLTFGSTSSAQPARRVAWIRRGSMASPSTRGAGHFLYE